MLPAELSLCGASAMREEHEFIKALVNMKPGPCLTCCHFDRCSSEKVACWDFQRYTDSKSVRGVDVDRHPNKRIYNSIFEAE
jgi:hypothetical protein